MVAVRVGVRPTNILDHYRSAILINGADIPGKYQGIDRIC
jgi:hypothetical protein